MRLLNKLIMLGHRYLGIAISLLVVVWFGSGIVMMYAGGMPRLAPELRLERLPDLDTSRVQLTLAEAVAKADYDATAGWSGGRVSLLMLMDRPAYRFTGGATVFADNGEVMEDVNLAQATTIASRFANVPENQIRHVGTLTSPDQWTLGQGRAMPQYKFAVDDEAGTELYVRASAGEVTLRTTSQQRFFAWIGVIPHWLYFAPLRVNQPLWYDIMVWTSSLACVLAIMGLVLMVTKLRRPKPFKLSAAIPYAGWMRWHYITGSVFGLFTLTWAFSGLLSMEPYTWTQVEAVSIPRDVFTGGALDFSKYGKVEPAVWNRALEGRGIKEVDFTRIQDEHYYLVRPAPPAGVEAARRERLHQPYNVNGRAEPDLLLLAADTMDVKREAFSTESLVARLEKGVPNTPIVEQTLLTDYDNYYYSRGRITPLPVLRVKFQDAMQTWLYVDPKLSQPLASINKYNRIERWAYNGLHSLDFSFWYNNASWYWGMLVPLLGGLASSLIGLCLGIARMRRGAARNLGALGKHGTRAAPAE